MNVTVENLAPCKKLIRFEIEPTEVDKAFDSTAKEFQGQAKLPGFRPGKAPRDMVVKKYGKEIEAEVKKKLMGDAYRDAIKEKKLDVIGYPDIEEIQFGKGQPLQFAATIETAPEFELPEYKGLPAKREKRSVTDEDVEKAINMLRDRQVDYKTVEREAKDGDVVVVNYTGTCDGKPITETAPAARGLTEQKNFWINMEPGAFIPGFATQLTGARAGDKRTVNVDFPADFVTPQLAGKKGVYEVEVVEVKEKVMPEVNDEFAKSYGAESLEKLRAGVRSDLQNELDYKLKRDVRNQVMNALLNQVNFDLPESSVAHETRNVVYNLVRENQKRGISRDVIEKEKDQIYNAAAVSAKERVKAHFLIQKIAEKEDIKVSQEEVLKRIQALAGMYQIPPDQFLKDLQKRNGLIEIYDQVASEKVIDFLEVNAKIETVEPAAPVNPS